jgi:hypothetical protein
VKPTQYHLMSIKPIAVTIRVEGSPNLRWLQKDKVYPKSGTLRASSHTIKLAADPSNERFPATVLTQAKMSHAFFSSAAEIAAADAATRPPSNKTTQYKHDLYISDPFVLEQNPQSSNPSRVVKIRIK